MTSSINFNNVFNSVSTHRAYFLRSLLHELLSTGLAYTFVSARIEYGITVLDQTYDAEVVIFYVIRELKQFKVVSN
jgi:hypothetical protein